MNISANGKPVEISAELNVTKLLDELKVEMPEYVSVQVDGRMILREQFDNTLIKEGSAVEFLYYMGGGTVSGAKAGNEGTSRC